MKQMSVFMLVVCGLAGCSSVDDSALNHTPDVMPMNVIDIAQAPEREDYDQQTERYGIDKFGALGSTPTYSNAYGAYKGQMLTKHIGDYVQNMTQDLIANMEYVTDDTPIGVTHFALLDGDLNSTNLLGHQMAESFIHELHKFRIPVIDYKTTDYIRVTGHGDFVLSRDFLELKQRYPIEYVLTGTLARHQGGYLVNARVLGLESKAVVATAQSLIPFYVADALLPSEQQHSDDSMRDGVRLIEGD
ncbi:FlgO family outer membrane protein [Aestuariibacter salexigens]|uniref:FlgO family outer membrane protein n=1 Tax=Aestuariibacter salexigens TaxID=226010 RepID=UPI000412E37F|nr:FlgO family outer membrane protein [Aestuariibacter salexigens]